MLGGIPTAMIMCSCSPIGPGAVEKSRPFETMKMWLESAITGPEGMLWHVSARLGRRSVPVLIFLLAFLIRLLAAGMWSDTEIHVDASEYLVLAQNIRFHGTLSFGGQHPWGADGQLNSPGPFLPTAARAPLYPFVIAGLWWRQTPPFREIWVLQALLGGLTALLVYFAALSVFGRSSAALAGLAMALAPQSAFWSATVMSDTLFTSLLTLGLWLWGRRMGLHAGIALGAATLTRAVLLPIVIATVLLAAISKFNRTLHLRIALGVLLVIFPWAVRNAVTQHAFVPVAVQGWGSSLLLSTIDVPYGSGRWSFYLSDSKVRDIIAGAPSETDAERQMMRAAMERISAHPLRWFWLRTRQYPRLFADSASYMYKVLPLPPSLIKTVFLCGNFLFLVLSVTGLYMARARWRNVYHLVLFPGFLAFAQFPLADSRYSVPMVPVMAIFAAFALLRLRTQKGTSPDPFLAPEEHALEDMSHVEIP